MRTRLALTTGLAATTLLVLTGCFGGGGGTGTGGTDGTGSTGGDGGTGGAGGISNCLQGSWDLDEQALAQDLGENLSQGGTINVVSSEASGEVTLAVDGANMTYVSDVTYTITVDMSEGLTMVVTQTQAGESSGGWSADGDQVVFEDWVSGITITNDIAINGESSSADFPLPETGDGVPMEVTCDGDTLTTHPTVSPFTSVWSRE